MCNGTINMTPLSNRSFVLGWSVSMSSNLSLSSNFSGIAILSFICSCTTLIFKTCCLLFAHIIQEALLDRSLLLDNHPTLRAYVVSWYEFIHDVHQFIHDVLECQRLLHLQPPHRCNCNKSLQMVGPNHSNATKIAWETTRRWTKNNNFVMFVVARDVSNCETWIRNVNNEWKILLGSQHIWFDSLHKWTYGV